MVFANYDIALEMPEIGRIYPFGCYNWRVLDTQSDKVFLLSEYILEFKEYCSEEYANRIYSSVTWEKCTLRSYLNNEFLNKFSQLDKSRIIETTVKNSHNLWYGTRGGRDTIDKVFLLSVDEVEKYLGNNDDYRSRIRKRWINGNIVKHRKGALVSNINNEIRTATYFDVRTHSWWLRTPGRNSDYATRVDRKGVIYVGGESVECSFKFGAGVRPALWLNIGELNEVTA